MKSKRVSQVEEVVRRVAAARLLIEVPELATYVTITRVDVSPDLRHATLWAGIVGEQSAEVVLKRLEGILGTLQRAVAHELQTKITPRLHVQIDTNAQYAADIDRLLKQT